jgi:MFS family permease
MPAGLRVLPGTGNGIPNGDVRLLFLARFLRLLAYGSLSVVLVLYLAALGVGGALIGLLLGLTLLGDTALSLFLATRADRLGRRRVLMLGALLMVLTAALLGAGSPTWVLVLALGMGVLSPSGNEAGPFLAVEQTALAGFVPAEARTRLFAWYNLTGSVATALGALCGGWLALAAQEMGLDGPHAYRPGLVLYALCGLGLWVCFARLSAAVEPGRGEAPQGAAGAWGLGSSRARVLHLAALFSLDAFGGGLVLQSVLAWWLHLRFGAGAGKLGSLFFAVNVLAALSYLLAGRLARRIGLLRTMVFTHLPANLLLMLVPLMPGFASAAAVLLIRALITQMDVPTRQAYLMAVVSPGERTAAAGITGVARSLGSAAAPVLTTTLTAAAYAAWPFWLAGVIKVTYDLLLWRGFAHIHPEHEHAASTGTVAPGSPGSPGR